MSEGKVKSSKVKVHQPPDGTSGLDGHFHVYIYDVFNQTFASGPSFDNIEKAVSFRRHEQEKIYVEQEAAPDLFDLPFISADPELVERVARDAEYRTLLQRDLKSEARARARRR